MYPSTKLANIFHRLFFYTGEKVNMAGDGSFPSKYPFS